MKTCSKCSVNKPFSEFQVNKRYKDGYVTWCKACMRAYQNKWEKDNEQHRTEYNRQNHIDNIEQRHDRSNRRTRERYHTEPAYKENKAQAKKKTRENKFKIDLDWTEKIRMWSRNSRRKRRVNKLNGGGSHTEREWQDLCKRYDYKCLCCKEVKPLTQDHVIPLNKGGSDNISNIQPLCKICNSKKHTKIIDYRK